jgi:hypothetical protein
MVGIAPLKPAHCHLVLPTFGRYDRHTWPGLRSVVQSRAYHTEIGGIENHEYAIIAALFLHFAQSSS